MELCRSLSLQKGSSFRLGRCNHSLLRSEYISLECDRITTYERLPDSAKLIHEGSAKHGQKKKKSVGFISKVFSFRKVLADFRTKERPRVTPIEENEKKKKSSWFPDPERRWPLQGWG